MHQKTVPIVPRTVEERVTFSVDILLDLTVYQSIAKMSSKAKEVVSRAEPCTYCRNRPDDMAAIKKSNMVIVGVSRSSTVHYWRIRENQPDRLVPVR